MTSTHLSRNLPASFPHTYRFRVTPDLVRKFTIPKDGNVTIHHVYLPILEYKREFFPDKVNPRSHEEPSGRVPRLIAESLATHPEEFHLLNRGILVLADSCSYDNQSQFLEITISSDETGGLADGATTDRVLSGMLDPSTLKQLNMGDQEVLAALTSGFVHIEVVSGDYESRRVRLAGARNTSVQVKEFALENLDHKFDWLKDALDGSQFKDRIRYRENDPQPVDVRTVLALMTLFHPKWTEEGREPVTAYTSKGGILFPRRRMASRLQTTRSGCNRYSAALRPRPPELSTSVRQVQPRGKGFRGEIWTPEGNQLPSRPDPSSSFDGSRDYLPRSRRMAISNCGCVASIAGFQQGLGVMEDRSICLF